MIILQAHAVLTLDRVFFTEILHFVSLAYCVYFIISSKATFGRISQVSHETPLPALINGFSFISSKFITNDVYLFSLPERKQRAKFLCKCTGPEIGSKCNLFHFHTIFSSPISSSFFSSSVYKYLYTI